MVAGRSSILNNRRLLGMWCVLVGSIFWIISPDFSSNRSAQPISQSIPLNARVLVVYNESAPQSLDVAQYYMTKRGIPASNLCAISSAQTTHINEWNTFVSTVKTPIQNCLNVIGRDRILYIVFSHLAPYKVGTPVRSIDQQIADIWDEYSAGDYRIGQHAYFAESQSQGNAYQPFISLADYRQQPSSQNLYSVWRLDSANADLAKGLVDKAMLAEVQGLEGRGCFDNRGDINGFTDYSYGSGDWDIHRSAELARLTGFSVTQDFYDQEFGTAPAPLRCDDAALYAGWYSVNNYNDAFTWKPGAIGLHTDSYSAYDVRGGTNWCANAVIRGITVTSGAIEEPFLDGVAHPDGVFRNLFEGANVGDALLRNTEHLKWMIVNIGDPLYRPFPYGIAPFNSPGVAPASLALHPLHVGGGGPSIATLTLPAPAATSDLLVTLSSSNTAIASTPASISITAGATSASFSVNTHSVSAVLLAKIAASYPGGTVSSTLVIQPNRAPVVSLTSPTDRASFTAPAGITVNAAASDIDGRISRVDFYAGITLIGTDSTSPYGIVWSNVATGNFELKATATDSAGATSGSLLISIRVDPAATPTPTPTPGPILLTEGNSGGAIALDAVSWLRDPYAVLTWHNFTTDQRTRVMLFAINLELLSGENSSAVTAQAEDSAQRVYPLAVEYVGKVPLFDWLSQVIVKLPDEIANAGDVWVSIKLRGVSSNKSLIRIKP